MSRQNPSDKIEKASWTLVAGAKDTVTTNIMTAVNSKKLDVKQEQLERLLSLVEASIDEGYHKGSRTFLKTVSDALASADDGKKKASA